MTNASEVKNLSKHYPTTGSGQAFLTVSKVIFNSEKGELNL